MGVSRDPLGREVYVPDGTLSRQENLALITNNTPTAAQVAYGGDYVWTVQGTFNGASVQLQSLGPDGSTYLNIGAAKTAAGLLSLVAGALSINPTPVAATLHMIALEL